MAQTWNEYEQQKLAERMGAPVLPPVDAWNAYESQQNAARTTPVGTEPPAGTQFIPSLEPAAEDVPEPGMLGRLANQTVDSILAARDQKLQGVSNRAKRDFYSGMPDRLEQQAEGAPAAPEWTKAPLAYTDQVAANMNTPFLPEYNALRFKPLNFDGTDPVEVTQGKNWVNIKDRPLTLAEIDPMMVKEKDWGKYLEASVKAMSTATFDASKDPVVLQQMEAMSAAFYKAKAAEKQRKALAKQHEVIEDDARLLDAQAGFRDEQTDLALERKREAALKEAKEIRKQAQSIQDYMDKNGYSDDEKARADLKIAELTKKAALLEDETAREDERDASSQENSLWYQEQANKIREGHLKLGEAEDMTDLERQQADQATRMGFMKALSIGQVREENERAQAEQMAMQAEDRQWTQEQRAEERAADQAQQEAIPAKMREQQKQQVMQAATLAERRASDFDQQIKDLQKELEGFVFYPANPDRKTPAVYSSAEGKEISQQEYEAKMQQIKRLSAYRDQIRTKAQEAYQQHVPGYADLIGTPPEIAPEPAPKQPEKFKRRSL